MIFAVFVNYALCGEKGFSGKEANQSLSKETGIDKDANETNERHAIVYYFHGKYRCHTCKRIEQFTKEAVRDFFKDEIETGLIVLKVINVDEKENSHFSNDYQLFTRSVVVSQMVNGKEERWKNLQRVWELVRDEKAFKEYIRSEIKAYL
jgi:hypothetical protein